MGIPNRSRCRQRKNCSVLQGVSVTTIPYCSANFRIFLQSLAYITPCTVSFSICCPKQRTCCARRASKNAVPFFPCAAIRTTPNTCPTVPVFLRLGVSFAASSPLFQFNALQRSVNQNAISVRKYPPATTCPQTEICKSCVLNDDPNIIIF